LTRRPPAFPCLISGRYASIPMDASPISCKSALHSALQALQAAAAAQGFKCTKHTRTDAGHDIVRFRCGSRGTVSPWTERKGSPATGEQPERCPVVQEGGPVEPEGEKAGAVPGATASSTRVTGGCMPSRGSGISAAAAKQALARVACRPRGKHSLTEGCKCLPLLELLTVVRSSGFQADSSTVEAASRYLRGTMLVLALAPFMAAFIAPPSLRLAAVDSATLHASQWHVAGSSSSSRAHNGHIHSAAPAKKARPATVAPRAEEIDAGETPEATEANKEHFPR
jgi:hypothetical protein